MKILVTGRGGQIARALGEQAGAHQLVFAARPEFDLADFGSIERLVAAVRPALVISAAAYTAVDAAEDERELALRINGEAPGVLARAAKVEGAGIIHLSTDYVFSGSVGRPWREDDQVAPMNSYGDSKLAGERAVIQSGARYAIVRTAWVYGPFGSNFVKTMLGLAETRDQLNVVDDQRGCPTSSCDIAEAIQTIVAAWEADRGRGANALYHLCGAGETNWADFARAIFQESASRGGPVAAITGIPSAAYPTRAMRPADSRLDCSRFVETFGYRPPDWRTSLARVMDRLLTRPAI